MSIKKYIPSSLEQKWQKVWEEKGIYKSEDKSLNPKKYILDMFPYPSGDGLHVGHFKGYVATDILSRYFRARGFNVLHPMGWDAFGLPAENYAIKTGIHPKITTANNISKIKRQMQMVGLSYDWLREINTTDPNYYKWTQWIFIKLFESGLAYEDEAPINWCPKDKTGLANEEVVNGNCERCGTPVVKKNIRQWILRITKYADRLLEDLEGLDWPRAIKDMQINWIGRKEGININYEVEGSDEKIVCFTTRPDTNFGATFIVIGPEHPLIYKVTKKEYLDAVEKYVKETINQSEEERIAQGKAKTGVFTGSYAINNLNGKKMPIWVSDFVLGNVGTGAVVGVPGHDLRDFEFAKKFNLFIKRVIAKDPEIVKSYLMGAKEINDKELTRLGIKLVEKLKSGERKIEIPKNNVKEYEQLINDKLTPGFWNEYISDDIVFIFKFKDGSIERIILDEQTEERIDKLAAEFNNQPWNEKRSVVGWLQENALYKDELLYEGEGTLINSDDFNGIRSEEARKKISDYIEKGHLEEKGWGIRVVNYHLRDWLFSRQRYWGEPIPIIHCKKCGLVTVPEQDLPLKLPEIEKYEPTGTGESPLASITDWVRTNCPNCKGEARRETNTMPQWAGSCWYYLRFIDPKNDKKLVDNKLEKYWMSIDWYVGGAEHAVLHLLYARFWHKVLFDIGVVNTKEPFQKLTNVGLILASDGKKMSKSLGNVVTPEKITDEYGADTLRVYEGFMGPFGSTISWDPTSINGVYRFLTRVWEVILKENAKDHENSIEVALVKLIKKVGQDIEQMKFNTAIASMMEFINLSFHQKLSLDQKKRLLIILAPFAPHITEELWQILYERHPELVSGSSREMPKQVRHDTFNSIHLQPWPKYEDKYLADTEVNIVIQINGKVRDQVKISSDMINDQSKIEEMALKSERVQKFLEGKTPKKIIYAKGKVLSLVV